MNYKRYFQYYENLIFIILIIFLITTIIIGCKYKNVEEFGNCIGEQCTIIQPNAQMGNSNPNIIDTLGDCYKMLIEKSECTHISDTISQQNPANAGVSSDSVSDTDVSQVDIYKKITSLFEDHDCSNLSDDSNKTQMLTYCLRMNNKCHDTQLKTGSPILTEKLMKDIKNTARKCNAAVDSDDKTGE
tara:strand:+ start:3707 stop:4267 length:561 start_codon:yes stop_codon:yes gene_type:complete